MKRKISFFNHYSLIINLPRASIINQKAFIKLTKSALISYLIIFFAFSSITGLFLFNPFGTKETEAAWPALSEAEGFNDDWGYA